MYLYLQYWKQNSTECYFFQIPAKFIFETLYKINRAWPHKADKMFSCWRFCYRQTARDTDRWYWTQSLFVILKGGHRPFIFFHNYSSQTVLEVNVNFFISVARFIYLSLFSLSFCRSSSNFNTNSNPWARSRSSNLTLGPNHWKHVWRVGFLIQVQVRA